ncbi:MFS transporter [Thermosediminibacter oceani]|uniref:Drug resistance transporter, EmrB/QacA subfamily n=1 Tax=Thermosediminibacter oceani (strain ATCC BAA-1034 / DSM 16646 / JW/IW-1228P) TaxID=555079 RepID=D9RYV4_THEOJ|nr:MFS transporter [Thermosediminibacter oceani]ADL08528.1 drug resistance transporter, EmrB/QacA subfamily [Thermosediminibacter oceani DSM 16646]
MRFNVEEKYKILFAVLIGSIMGPLDGSAVNVAMPTLSTFFNAGMTTVSWVSMAYLLVLSGLLLTYGRLGDVIGYKKLFLRGILVFTAASALCGLSPFIGFLILARALQAAGAGMMMAVAPAIITTTFPRRERGKALGFNAVAVATGMSIGPSVGGFLLNALGWRSIFLINIPIGIGGYLWAKKVLPAGQSLKHAKFDVPGAVLGLSFLTALLLYISKGQELSWSSLYARSLVVISLVSLAAFVMHEKRAEDPMLDLKLFSNRTFTAGNLSCLLNFTAQYIMVFLTPFYLDRAGFSPSQVGGIMTAFPLTVLFVAPLSGMLSDRLGSLLLSTMGAFTCAAALFLMGGLGLDSGTPDVVWRLMLFGIGNGLFQTPNNSSVMGSAPMNRQGVASGVLATMRNVGMVVGVAVASGFFSARNSYYMTILPYSGQALLDAAFIRALRDAYFLAAFIDLLCMLASSVRGKSTYSDENRKTEKSR